MTPFYRRLATSVGVLAVLLALLAVRRGVVFETPSGQVGLRPDTTTTDAAVVRDEWHAQRRRMVEWQMSGRDITDARVLAVMGKIPRHEFLPEDRRNLAYRDHPVPIGYGQTISQPYIVALMTQVLDIKPGDRVLEIGTGSGYQAAVLAELNAEVYTVEIVEPLATAAIARLQRLGYGDIQVRNSDGYFGWPDKAPFDKIIITAAVNHIPPPLLEQLKEGGRLILPLGSTLRFQTLTLVTKRGGEFDTEHITGVSFVPLTGAAQRAR